MFVLCLTISITRNFPVYHPLSWWNVCWIVLPFALAVWATGNSWLIFRPIRWLCWPGAKTHLEMKLKKLDKNPMVYPALMWLEFNGQTAFLAGGFKGLQEGLFGHSDKVAEGLKQMFTKAAEEHKCCGGDCGCHEDKAI